MSGPAKTTDELRRILETDLHNAPGHLFRRAQQRAVEIYRQEVGENGLRPRQFAVLLTVQQNPGISQSALVRMTGIDRSTIAEMVGRLVRKNLIARSRTTADQRANRLTVTGGGTTALLDAFNAVQRAQIRIMEPVPASERTRFLENLKLLGDLPGEG